MTDKREHIVRVTKLDEDRRIIFGEVYQPFELDTYGEMMLPEDIEVMAHRFMSLPNLNEVIDTNHDNNPNGSFPVESFIARKGDPDFNEGAWVLGVKVPDDNIWARVKTGDLNGFSMQSLVKPVAVKTVISVFRDHVGQTEKNGTNDHDHMFFVQLDDAGVVISGHTSFDAGHSHRIRRASVTEKKSGHAHRFFL